MPEHETEMERRPKMKVIYMADAEGIGTEPGFKNMVQGEKYVEATYINRARLLFEHPTPVTPVDGEGNMVHNPKTGGWYMWRVTDYDHGHQMVLFFSERVSKNEDTGEPQYTVPYVVKDLRTHFKQLGLVPENHRKFLFELGKTKAKTGSQGKWYCRLLSTTADVPGMFDDPSSARFKDDFQMSTSEKAIVAKVNSLVEQGGLPKDFSKDMFLTTFVSGAAGPPTTQRRADIIWGLAKDHPDKTGLHPDICKAIKNLP